ncbi:hypothetical protein BDZ89DRAFT_1215013 [Hymenopellis radicata]|nr:hypothetical protein BDZ89DRAFT_1215013 [Hymenopellis radicata]
MHVMLTRGRRRWSAIGLEQIFELRLREKKAATNLTAGLQSPAQGRPDSTQAGCQMVSVVDVGGRAATALEMVTFNYINHVQYIIFYDHINVIGESTAYMFIVLSFIHARRLSLSNCAGPVDVHDRGPSTVEYPDATIHVGGGLYAASSPRSDWLCSATLENEDNAYATSIQRVAAVSRRMIVEVVAHYKPSGGINGARRGKDQRCPYRKKKRYHRTQSSKAPEDIIRLERRRP